MELHLYDKVRGKAELATLLDERKAVREISPAKILIKYTGWWHMPLTPELRGRDRKIVEFKVTLWCTK